MVNTGGHAIDILTGLLIALIDNFDIENINLNGYVVLCTSGTEILLREIWNFDTSKFEISRINWVEKH